jgi:C4-dicarboxylate transporter
MSPLASSSPKSLLAPRQLRLWEIVYYLRINSKSDLKGDIARLEADFHKTMTAQTWRVVGFVVAGTAFVQGFMKFLA